MHNQKKEMENDAEDEDIDEELDGKGTFLNQEDEVSEEEEDSQDSFIVDDNMINVDKAHDLPKITKKNKKKKNEGEEELWEFPKTLGGKLTMDNPVLEFIKFFVESLSLDENIQEQLIVLKRNALKILKISDFSKIAEF